MKLRCTLAQINTTIGDFDGNCAKILSILKNSAEQGADIVVFPELCIGSYPPLDLLDREDFASELITKHQQLIDDAGKLSTKPKAFILGSIAKSEKSFGRWLHNAAYFYELEGSRYVLKHIQSKRLLPTYDVFDESRYFEAGESSQCIDFQGLKIGVSVCEDAWFEDQRHGKTNYAKDPAVDLKGASLIFNISASPFELSKRNRRHEMMKAFAKKTNAPLLYVNQVGANDEIIFDGLSFAMDENGTILAQAEAFSEASLTLDLEFDEHKKFKAAHAVDPKHATVKKYDDLTLLYEALKIGIRDYFKKTGFEKAVLGLSGGIDSALVATLAVDALGAQNVVGVAMPSQYSSPHSIEDAELLARNLGIEFRVHSIKFVFSSLSLELKPTFLGLPADITEENMQSRLRGMILLAIANKRKALVLTTGNKSELAVGYCTTYGDMAGALAPLGDVYKTKVFALAKFINSNAKALRIPERTITKPPSAELRPNQKDEDSLGSYDTLDAVLEKHLEDMRSAKEIIADGFSEQDVQKILRLVRISEFKRRQAAPVLKVTTKAFGIGRRIPIVKNF